MDFKEWGYPPASPPTVTSNATTGITRDTARLNGYLSNNGGATTTVGFYYGTSSPPATKYVNGTCTAPKGFYHTLTGLSPGTRYYVRAYGNNSAGATNGSILSFFTLGNWTTKQSGWNRFNDVVSWLTKQSGYDTFSNIASWLTRQTGYDTFGNTAAWTAATQGWSTFQNTPGYMPVDQGWSTFDNQSAWAIIDQGWNTFRHNDAWQNKTQGWDTFGNGVSWYPLISGWNIFGNTSVWVNITQGWNTFYNNNWTVFIDWSPKQGDVIDLIGFSFMANISDTNGTLMSLTWEYWNGTGWVFITNQTSLGNGTYHQDPSPWLGLLYNHTYTYRVTLTGTQTANKTVAFTTPKNAGVVITNQMVACSILSTVFGTFMTMGYAVRKRSAGMYLTMAGFTFLALMLFLPANLAVFTIMVVFAAYVIFIGVKKTFFSNI